MISTLFAALMMVRVAAAGPGDVEPGGPDSQEEEREVRVEKRVWKGGGSQDDLIQREMFPDDFLEHLTRKLDLRQDQQVKIKAILDKANPEKGKLVAEMKALHERLKKFMQQTRESVRETLDLDQKGRFDQMVQHMGHRGMGRGGGRRGRHGMRQGPGGGEPRSGAPSPRGEDEPDGPGDRED